MRCSWCLGGRMLYERMDAGEPWELLPVICRNCDGMGSVRIERRTGER